MALKEPLTIRTSGAYVHQLVTTINRRWLRKEQGIIPRGVVKAGSLGQGTAIPGDFDLDLVLYSSSIKPATVKDRGVHDVLEKLQKYLKKHLGSTCTDIQLTDYAVTFLYRGELYVDLLPSPYWSSMEEFHHYLGTIEADERRHFSCSAAKWEKRFFQRQPSKVKEYIKIAKKWRNEKWPIKQNSDGRPKSILIGVLMIEAYRRSRPSSRHSSSHEKVRQEFRALILTHRTLQINLVGERHDLSTPYILDPANPYNNLYLSGIGNYKASEPEAKYKYGPGNGNWTAFVAKIDTLDLSKGV